MRAALRALLAEDYERAEEALTALVREDSRDVDAYLGLARLYRRRGEVGRAIQVHQNLLLRADLTHDARVEALTGLADDFREGGFQRRAVAAFEEVLAHDSKHRGALEGLLAALTDLEDYEPALAIQHRLARLETPDDPDAEVSLLTRMAESAHAEGEADRARKQLKRALRKNPRHLPARTLLGELEALRGKNKAALAAWRQVAELGGKAAASIYPKLASAFASQGRGADHESFLRELSKQRPDDPALGVALARALGQRGDLDAAVDELRRLLDARPRDLTARIVLGQLLLSDGRDAEAKKEYGELLELLDQGESSDHGHDLTPPERLE